MTTNGLRQAVAGSLAATPIIGVLRTQSQDEALQQADVLISGGVELVEVTFTVPDAPSVVRRLLDARGADGPPWIGSGTVTSGARAQAALDAGAEFIVSPNVSEDVAREARAADRFLVLGALTCTEVVAALDLGADIVKVYPLPPVGGPLYLSTIRQPLGDVPMLAAGGFGVTEIPEYRAAGASAFGMGAPLLIGDAADAQENVVSAVAIARGRDGA